ncbi:MAG: trypsin-like peptidase domain-containing protein [Candidatus Dormiibacterota bacterium]
MTDQMEYLPYDPPPPPPGEPPGAVYGHWSSNPQWGPPSWPPAPQRSGGSGFRRTALALFAVACVGAGGGTAWALTTASISSPSTGSQPGGSTGPGGATNPNTGSSVPSTGSSLSAATIAKLDSAIVDITADTASPGGQVAGTGMVITSNGEVLTNNHVIDDTVNIRAQIDGTGTVYTVKVIGYDLNDDIALVQLVGASNLPTVPIGDATKLSVGDPITVLGNALGKGGTPAVVGGTIAQLDTQITASDDSGNTETLTGMIQVSAAIEPGDSGGPEVNAAGQVIGITTAGQTSGNPNQQSASTTGFAIPINKAMLVVSEIRSGSGPNIHIGNAALLGVAVSHVQPGIDNSLPNCTSSRANTGAWISGVTANSPAAGAGVTVCGRIIWIGGNSIANDSDLHTAMAAFLVGQTVSLKWLDASAVTHTATVTLGQASFPD